LKNINYLFSNDYYYEQKEIKKHLTRAMHPIATLRVIFSFPKRCALRERPAEPSLIIPSRADSRSGTIGWSRSPSQGSAQPGVGRYRMILKR